MKKAYSKPEIVFENFSLSTNIAGDCETKTNLLSNNVCGIEFTGLGTVFLDTMGGCNGENGYPIDSVGGDGEFNGICYHVPADINNLFNSYQTTEGRASVWRGLQTI